MVQVAPPVWGQDARDALLAALAQEHGPGLTRYAARLLGDREAAQDCVQDALERAYRWFPLLLARGRFRPEGWLYRTVGNRCRDVLRRRRHESLDSDTPDGGAGPEREALRRERAAQVRRILASLPARQGLALWLRDAEGRPPTEVGGRLGLTPGSAKVFLVEARRAFRAAAALRGYGDEWVAEGLRAPRAVVGG